MNASDPLDNRLTALRMLHVAAMIVVSGFAGVAIFSGTRIGGPIFPGPVPAYGFLAAGLLALGLVPLVGRKVGPAAGRAADGEYPAFAADRSARAALLLVPGAVFVFGFFVTQNWLILAPLPLLHLFLVAGLPGRRRFEAWRAERQTR